eukprot:1629567-Amphidinium_carterae.1
MRRAVALITPTAHDTLCVRACARFPNSIIVPHQTSECIRDTAPLTTLLTLNVRSFFGAQKPPLPICTLAAEQPAALPVQSYFCKACRVNFSGSVEARVPGELVMAFSLIVKAKHSFLRERVVEQLKSAVE